MEEEAIALANDTEYGLSAAAFTYDINRAMGISNKLRAGNVRINCCMKTDSQVPSAWVPEGSIVNTS